MQSIASGARPRLPAETDRTEGSGRKTFRPQSFECSISAERYAVMRAVAAYAVRGMARGGVVRVMQAAECCQPRSKMVYENPPPIGGGRQVNRWRERRDKIAALRRGRCSESGVAGRFRAMLRRRGRAYACEEIPVGDPSAQ